jgi:BlaI family transcriptional regulator, penicillinase repressor
LARHGSETLTDREAQIMEVVWSHGEVTAEQVRDLLPDRPHDSTVRTLLRILGEKGYITRTGPGRPVRYRAVVSRAKVQRTALHRMLGRLFGGSPQALALRLLEDRHLTPAQLEEIARLASKDSSESQGQTPAPMGGSKRPRKDNRKGGPA